MNMLGKLPARHDQRTLRLADYLTTLPTPKAVNWALKSLVWPMMLNDSIGDCTCAAAGHMIEAWTSDVSLANKVVPSDGDILHAYEAITGYNPGDPSTDQGANELDVLNYWRKTGVGGHKIGAYAALEPRNRSHVEASVDLFGGVYIGVSLPISAQNQRTWSVTHGPNSAPGSWGGHAVPVLAYNRLGLTVVTWGALKNMTWRFWEEYCDEAYAVLSQDWIDAAGKAPSGFDLATLQADLALVTG